MFIWVSMKDCLLTFRGSRGYASSYLFPFPVESSSLFNLLCSSQLFFLKVLMWVWFSNPPSAPPMAPSTPNSASGTFKLWTSLLHLSLKIHLFYPYQGFQFFLLSRFIKSNETVGTGGENFLRDENGDEAKHHRLQSQSTAILLCLTTMPRDDPFWLRQDEVLQIRWSRL